MPCNHFLEHSNIYIMQNNIYNAGSVACGLAVKESILFCFNQLLKGRVAKIDVTLYKRSPFLYQNIKSAAQLDGSFIAECPDCYECIIDSVKARELASIAIFSANPVVDFVYSLDSLNIKPRYIKIFRPLYLQDIRKNNEELVQALSTLEATYVDMHL